MIRQEITTSILRFYADGDDSEMAPYVASCALIWEGQHVVWVKALHGKLTRKLLRELLEFLVEQNVTTIKAVRAEGHTLPFAVAVHGHYEMDVTALAARFL